MSYEIETQLFRMHAKLNRDYLFKSPEALWEAACGYFEWCEEHAVFLIVKGHPSQPVLPLPKLRAYTLRGLCIYLGCGSRYFHRFEAQLAGKTDEVSEEYKRVISLIHDVIYEQKFTAAAAGELNPGLIARELNLAYNSLTSANGDPSAANNNESGDAKKPRSVIVWGEHEIPI